MNQFRNLVDALDAAPADRPFITAWVDEDERETVTFADSAMPAFRHKFFATTE